MELPAKQHCQFSPFGPTSEVNGLDWQCCLAGSFKTAPRILIFSIGIGANYSYEMKNSEIWAPAFFKHNNSFIATVKRPQRIVFLYSLESGNAIHAPIILKWGRFVNMENKYEQLDFACFEWLHQCNATPRIKSRIHILCTLFRNQDLGSWFYNWRCLF